jgi:hypothetical protein
LTQASDGTPLDEPTTIRAARGAYPAELFDGRPVGASATAYGGQAYSPELHILDAEWYFTPSTSKVLADLLRPGPACLLGTPTVANELRKESCLLVDSSPFVRQRFGGISADKVLTTRIDAGTRVGRFASVLLDPPWYQPELRDWLQVAFRALETGGRLLMPLIGEGTRPSAAADRASILDLLAAAGQVEIVTDAVEYDIPLFEARALAAAGITLAAPWRRADLASVEVVRVPEFPELGDLPDESDGTAWSTYVIGSQVVKLRVTESTAEPQQPPLADVPGVQEFVLDSVSRRDPRRPAIELWTSRNKVARVLDRAAVASALDELAGSAEGLEARIDKFVAGSSSDLADRLLRLLELARD